MVIGYMAISYIRIVYVYCYWLYGNQLCGYWLWVLTFDNWKLGIGIGYQLLVMGMWLWLLTIWIGLGLVFQGLGLGQASCEFECLGFRVMVFQVWSDFQGFGLLEHNRVCVEYGS